MGILIGILAGAAVTAISIYFWVLHLVNKEWKR